MPSPTPFRSPLGSPRAEAADALLHLSSGSGSPEPLPMRPPTPLVLRRVRGQVASRSRPYRRRSPVRTSPALPLGQVSLEEEVRYLSREVANMRRDFRDAEARVGVPLTGTK